MKKPILSIISAIAENRAIGKDNKLLWHIKKDFLFFKNKTTGHVLLMGQKTYASIGKPLPNRITIVVSNDMDFNPDGVIVCRTLEDGINKARELEKEEIFICGGGSIYAQTIDLADKLYLTVIKGNFEADTFFPDYLMFKNIVNMTEDSDENYKFKFLELVR